jgi:histone deacetylase complex subunit SAP30
MSTRNSQKPKPPYVVPVQKEYVNKYVHNNHPDNIYTTNEGRLIADTNLNISVEQLREYRVRYLNPSHQLSPDISTFQGFLLQNNTLGERTESSKANVQRKEENNLYDYRTSDDLAINVENHIKNQLQVKESEAIVDFVYKVRSEKDKFRLRFDRS